MIADFTWGNLDNFNLKDEFRNNAQQRLDDLKKDTTRPSSRGVYKVLACLSNKHTKKIDDNTLTDFFKQIESTLPNDMPYMVDMSRPLTSDKFTSKRKSTILQHLCFKAIKNDKHQLATQILQLTSEPILGTEKKGDASLHLALFALKKGKELVPLVKEILKKISRKEGLVQTYLNQVNEQGESLLILAAKLELDDLINYLINQMVDCDLIDHEGETALSIAIKNKRSTQSLSKLISLMNDFTYLDRDGNNYLHLAVQKGLPEIIAPLLAKFPLGIYAQNKEDKTVLELAFAGGYQEIAKELIKHTINGATCRHCIPLLSIATRHYLPLAIEKKWEDVAIELFRKKTYDFYEKQSPEEIFNHYKRALENKLHQFAELYFAQLFASNAVNKIQTDSRYLTEALDKGSSKLIQEFLPPNRQVLPFGSEAQLLKAIVRFYPQESFSTLIKNLFTKIEMNEISNYMTYIRENFSLEVQEKIAQAILQSRHSELHKGLQNLLISSIAANWDLIIPSLIEKGAIIDDKNDSAFHHALLKQSEPITRLFLSVLLPNKEDQLSPEMLDSQAKPTITPKSLAWFFKTFVTNPEWKDHMIKLSPKSFFEQLLDSAYDNEHVLDQEVFRSAASLQNYKAILKDFALKCLHGESDKSKSPSDLINYIGGMAPLNDYLEAPMQQRFLDIFGPLSAKEDLTHSQAKTLAKLFPNYTLSIQFPDLDQPLEGFNHFILNSSPYLRMLISRECNDQSKILSLTEITSSYFKIIYNFLSERRLETSTLNEESKIELESILKLYRGSPPDQKEMKSHDSIITEFLKDPYTSDCTELQIDASTMTLDHAVLKEYFSYLPNLIMIKCDDDVLDKSPLFWELLIKTLPKFKTVEVTFQKPSNQFKLPPPLANHLFFFKGLNHADSSLLTAIQQCQVRGLDFSNQSRFDLSLNASFLQKIQYLNFSNAGITKEQLIPTLQATPELREINLENCQHLTDLELLDIRKICPLLEKIYLSHVSDAALEKALSQNKGLTFYVGKKRVESQSSVIRALKLEQMIELVQDAYLLESDAHYILNVFLKNLHSINHASFRDALIELLTMIKGKESKTAHPLISFTQQVMEKQLKDFYSSLADKLQGHTLDEYLNSNDLNDFYIILTDFITKTKPTIRRARILSNLFSPKAIPLIPLTIGRHPDAPKRPATLYPIHPLILLSAGKKLKGICESPKIYSLSEIVLHYIHAYLQEGKTNLKRIGLDSLLEIIEEFEKVGLSVRNFLRAAADEQVNIKLSRSTPASIIALLNHQAIKYITGVDLVKSRLKITDIADLMKKAKNLKTIRIPAQPIPEDSWKELIAKGMLVTLVFNGPAEFKAFKFPSAELFNQSNSRIHLELGDQVRDLSLPEYLEIIQSIPALNNIDLSDFELCKGSDELNNLIKICKVHPKILDLGNCETLDKQDFEKIAKICEGLKEFRCSHKNPDLIKQIFSKHAFDICEIKQIEAKKASKENLPTVDLTGFVEVDAQSVIDACNTESPMVLNLGNFVFNKQEIESIAKACPNLLVLFCSQKYSFNVLEIFQKISAGVSYGQ